MELRRARPDEASFLSDLALRSKAHWGYDDAFLDAGRAELTLEPSDISRRRATVALDADRIVGFYALDGEPPDGDLGLFFVEPDRIGTGVGRAMWAHLTDLARSLGFERLRVEADPGAEGFYLSMGAVRAGTAPSGSIPGRELPLLVFALVPAPISGASDDDPAPTMGGGLDDPSPTVEGDASPTGEGEPPRVRGRVSQATAQGPRPGQEDRFAAVRLDDGWLLAVLDGHGGDEASEAGVRALERAFGMARSNRSSREGILEATVASLVSETKDVVAGATVSLAFVDERAGRVAAAVLGDSPVVVRDRLGVLHGGAVHNTHVNHPDRDRAIAEGAVYMGGYLCDPDTLDGVNLTRSIGDARFPFVAKEPETFEVDIGPGSWVLVASDGLYVAGFPDPIRLGEAVREAVDSGAGAEDLVREATESGPDDNTTVVLWRAD